MTEDNFKVEVVGDLTEDEAHKFVYGDGVGGGWAGIINDLSDSVQVPVGAEEQWPAIYERCGGNISRLRQFEFNAGLKKTWSEGLQTVVAGPLEEVNRGFSPSIYIVRGGEAPLWTGAQWKMVLEKIITAPHHAVLASEVKEALGNGDEKLGSKILLSMLKYNLLTLRPYSRLARDLPEEVYGEKKAPVVTLHSAAHEWCAKALLEDSRTC